jgi:HSP20 family protein
MHAPQPIDRATEEVTERPTFRPTVDIFENQDEILLVADMPGVDRDAIRIDVDQKVLTIAAARPDDTPSAARILGGVPARFDWKRVFALSDAVDPERIAATYRDGVLEVRLPRHERTRPRRIAIAGA